MKPWNMPFAYNIPLALVEIAETPTTLTLRQTRAPALRDLRNLIETWRLPIAVSITLFACSSEFFAPFWNHRETTSSGGSGDPLRFLMIAWFSLVIGRMLLYPICGLFGKATIVFDKGRDVLLRNGRSVGPLREICAIKPQVGKGMENNPVFSLVLELPQGRPVVVAETHHVPGRGEFQVSRDRMGPSMAFCYLDRWLDYDAQDYVPFLDPEIAEIERRITLFLER